MSDSDSVNEHSFLDAMQDVRVPAQLSYLSTGTESLAIQYFLVWAEPRPGT